MLNTFLAIYIYLISSGPGTHAYTWYGHTAVEVIDTQRNIDVCFNYGFFSFHSKNFYGNFVKGRTYYELLVERTDDFYEDCKYECRGNIIRQELNLTEEKKREFVQALFINALPANSRYLYNFVYDNCATRPYKLIKHLLGDTLISSYSGFEGQTYRQFIQRYSRKGSWFDLGINLIFGYRSDKKMYGEARLFLPEALMFYMEEARYNDSIPLVTSSNIHAFDIMPVPWYKTWYCGLVIYILFLGGLTYWDRRRGKLSVFVDIFVGGIYVLLLLLVCYLTFFSLHPLVGFSWRLLIFPILHICIRLYYFVR